MIMTRPMISPRTSGGGGGGGGALGQLGQHVHLGGIAAAVAPDACAHVAAQGLPMLPPAVSVRSAA
jgi:hypothetical protein